MSWYRQQVGALCFKYSGKQDLRVLLITSRETRRWVIPKGWPAKGEEFHLAAAREANEEAGAEGVIQSNALGEYIYAKRWPTRITPLRVLVYPLRVVKLRRRWPEDAERERRWFPIEMAVEAVADPDLAALLRQFALARDPIGDTFELSTEAQA
jgi:8-oxo-dGTP pyrophosphatase MutT (NUDIX family)